MPSMLRILIFLIPSPKTKASLVPVRLTVPNSKRRLVTTNAVVPSYLQSRVLHDVPLPRVSLSPAGSGIEEKDRSLLAFLLGMAGPENTGMPRDVFRVLLDFLMPTWDPLRREKTV